MIVALTVNVTVAVTVSVSVSVAVTLLRYSNVVAGKLTYPETFSSSYVSLLQGLLQKNPAKRLGNAKGGVAEIKKHK